METHRKELTNENYKSGTPPYEFKKRIWGLIRHLALPLAFSILYPLAFYYGLRAMGVNSFFSLIIGALPIVGFQVYQLVKKRKIDLLGILTLVILGLSVVMAFITGSARFMLAKAGFFTALIGGGFLASLLFKRPIVYTLTVYLLWRMEVSKNYLERLWVGVPKFRRVWRVSTVIWGLGTLLNAVIILGLAYMLPVDIVPLLNTVVHLIIFVVLQIITHFYYKRQGIWKLVFHPETARKELSTR